MTQQPEGAVLIVFEMLEPYCHEVVPILALPNGAITRFRYTRRWLSLAQPGEARGSECLICIRATQTATVVPLRFGRITEVLDVGDIFHFRVKLGSFVELSRVPIDQVSQLTRFNAELATSAFQGLENRPRTGLEKLVMPSWSFAGFFGDHSYSGSERGREASRWGALVELLVGHRELADLDFLYLLSLSPDGEKAPAMNNDGSVRLSAATHYQLNLLQRRRNVLPRKEIGISFDKVTLIPTLDSQMAVGQYDVLTFAFRTATAQSGEQKTAMVVRASCADEDAVLFPPIVVPVGVAGQSRLVLACGAFCFFLAAMVLLVPGVVAAILPESDPTAAQFKNVAVMVAIATSSTAGKVGGMIATKLFKL